MPLLPQHPDHPEEDIPEYDDVPPLEAADAVVPDEVVGTSAGTDSPFPPLILGCATFGYGIYADTSLLRSTTPLRVVRLALASGVTAFDTAAWYHPSEIILGNCLKALKEEWPRETYELISKVGKYGSGPADHTYERGTVRRCVERSLRRLGTDYLDAVYLHDVENLSSYRCPAGNPLLALDPAHAASYGLTEPQLTPTKGDLEILEGLAELRFLQTEGKVKYVGIAGYPLPVLLRVALLALHTTGKPVDIVQTYAHRTLANSALEQYIPVFRDRAKVPFITNASPLSMGLLTRTGGPTWHSAHKTPLWNAVMEAVQLCEREGTSIEDVATDYGFRDIPGVPCVVGCKNLEELHLNLKSYKRANGAESAGKGARQDVAEKVVKLFEVKGVRNWSWQNPR